MRTNEPKPVVVMGAGKSKFIRDVSCSELDCLHEPLPDAISILLCLLDGAERRHNLMTKRRLPNPKRPVVPQFEIRSL